MRIPGAARRASLFVPVLLALGLLAGAGTTSDGRASSGPSAPRAKKATGIARLAAAGSGDLVPSFDTAVYAACAAAPVSNPNGLEPFEANVAGWSDISKLSEATAAGDPVPATATAGKGQGFWYNSVVVDGSTYFCQDATASLDYKGQREFPPLRATFLAFGTVPVTATAYLVQSGAQPLTAVSWDDDSAPGGSGSDANAGAVVTSRVVLRIADVTVNGTPLDVGARCQTTGPLHSPASAADPDPTANPLLVMVGGDVAADGDPRPYYSNAQGGGALAGEAIIPSFTGCTTPDGENLDSLLDASISGPGNYLRFQQGPGCVEGSGYCATGTATPLPGALWTVENGGSYTAASTGPVTFTTAGLLKHVSISCPASAISGGAIPDAAGPPRGPQASPVRLSFSGDCTGTQITRTGATSPFGTWTVTAEGTTSPDFTFYDPANGTVLETLWGLTLDLTGTGVPGATAPCTMQMIGPLRLQYADATARLSPSSNSSFAPSLNEVSSTCPSPINGLGGATMDFDYQLNRHIQITSP